MNKRFLLSDTERYNNIITDKIRYKIYTIIILIIFVIILLLILFFGD